MFIGVQNIVSWYPTAGRAQPRYAGGTTTRRLESVRHSSGEDAMAMTIVFGLVDSASVAVKVASLHSLIVLNLFKNTFQSFSLPEQWKSHIYM